MCKKIDGTPSLGQGWGCCGPNCNTFNGDMREECKFCGKQRCENSKFKTKEIIYENTTGHIIVQKVNRPDGSIN